MYRRRLLVLILILTIFFTLFCTTKTAVVDFDNIEIDLQFTYEQMLDDYDLFWSMLHENLPFVITAVNNMGKEDMQNYYRNMIQKDTSAQEFADIIIECVNEFNSSAHMKVVTKEHRDKYMQILTSSPEIMNVLNNSKSEVLYDTLDISMERIYSYVSKNEVNMDGFKCVDDSINAYIFKDENIAYIRFDDFSPQSEKISRFLLFYNKIAEYDNLIIDVRNNPGGSNFVWKNCVVSLLASEDIQYDNYAMFNMGSNTSLFYTKHNPKLFESTITEKDWIYNTSYFTNTINQNMNTKDVIVKSKGTVKKDNKSIKYKGKVWVLIDENSFSAADSFSYFCKTTDFATTVGSKTKGNGVSPIEDIICFYSLPNSGIIIRYFPYMGFNIDGSSNIESGDIADISIHEGEDALQVCIKEIYKIK